MELPLLWVLLLLFFRECESEPHPPVIVDNTDAAVVVSEDTKIGTVLWTLKAMDEDGDDVIIGYPEYEAESKTLVTIRQTIRTNGNASADIILDKILDRDYNSDRRQLHFIIQDNSELNFKIDVLVDLVISDVNDEVPVFQNLPYRLQIPENEAWNQVVYESIQARDPDTGIGGKLAYSMQESRCTESTAVLKYYTIVRLSVHRDSCKLIHDFHF
ncbi:cadherin-related family member 1-like [Mya arenaria]|uniref:cadherin-related family member 1-like n=1 Tax=Mya arenaria TaxID=6604 RepID=UPI0022E83786|nr:cadherin-related family member 1-like [Mya arenaria]